MDIYNNFIKLFIGFYTKISFMLQFDKDRQFIMQQIVDLYCEKCYN